jgi:hypothetical protein
LIFNGLCLGSDKAIIAVVDANIVPYLEDEWRNLPPQRKLIDLYATIPK